MEKERVKDEQDICVLECMLSDLHTDDFVLFRHESKKTCKHMIFVTVVIRCASYMSNYKYPIFFQTIISLSRDYIKQALQYETAKMILVYLTTLSPTSEEICKWGTRASL